MLAFVGLGLYDQHSVTLRGRRLIRGADRVVAEFYTSRLGGTDAASLARFHDTEIEVLDRNTIETDPGELLADAADRQVVFVTGGDPMVSTTHVDLRLRAIEEGIETRVVHAPSIETAAAGLTGLQNYRFGKATTLPFPGTFGEDLPTSVRETIRANRDRGLHTLVYLDLDETGVEALTADTAAGVLAPAFGDTLGVVIARAGGDAPTVRADTVANLREGDFGPPLHVLVLPGDLHDMEAEALRTLGGAPPGVIDRHRLE